LARNKHKADRTGGGPPLRDFRRLGR
jgi:hypothetical protein